MSRFAAIAALAFLLVALVPEAAQACAVCFDSRDENRQAFIATTIFLSLFPLGMVAGTGLWIRKRARDLEAEERALEAQEQALEGKEPQQ